MLKVLTQKGRLEVQGKDEKSSSEIRMDCVESEGISPSTLGTELLLIGNACEAKLPVAAGLAGLAKMPPMHGWVRSHSVTVEVWRLASGVHQASEHPSLSRRRQRRRPGPGFLSWIADCRSEAKIHDVEETRTVREHRPAAGKGTDEEVRKGCERNSTWPQ